MEVHVLIVEDNPLTSQDLKEIILENGMKVIGIAKNKMEATSLFNGMHPDILLVDINLKEGDSGIDFVNEIHKNQDVPVVYLTANSDKETVEKALKTKPVSYLTKPYDDRDVIIALELAFSNYCANVLDKEEDENTFIFLKTGKFFEKVALKEIQYLKAEGSYTRFATLDKEYIISHNLNQSFQKVGAGNFLRVHRSYVINTSHVSGLDFEQVYLGDQSIPIGRSFKEDVKKVLNRI